MLVGVGSNVACVEGQFSGRVCTIIDSTMSVLAGGVLFQNVIWSGGADNVNTYYERHAPEDWQSRQQVNRLGINQLATGVSL